MKLPRASGILLHPTSLPGPDGIGDFGPEAYNWLDFLHQAGVKLWQVLPLGPTGYGDSPYQCFSAFAGNPLLISPSLLFEEGLIEYAFLQNRPEFPAGSVDYGAVITWKKRVLHEAFRKFSAKPDPELLQKYEAFVASQHAWLENFSLFMAIKASQSQKSWLDWPEALKLRDPNALQEFRAHHDEEIRFQRFQQFLFFEQWSALKQYANKKGISIIGDVPIFISIDSAEAWANKDLFLIDEHGNPAFVAGVPPDYFSPTGQYWGNPLYDWTKHLSSQFSWWTDRMKSSFQLFDWVRLDHFRGFAAYWKIPFGSPTAEVGNWEKAPGELLFKQLQSVFNDLPIIAEDLGVITPDVEALRDQFGFPGMRVLQFAFGEDATNLFLPHNFVVNGVAYTGTHDNDTSKGWFAAATTEEQKFCLKYLDTLPENVAWSMIREVWKSVAAFAIAPIQDFLELGNEARMNFPSKVSGNWQWRMQEADASIELAAKIADLNQLYYR